MRKGFMTRTRRRAYEKSTLFSCACAHHLQLCCWYFVLILFSAASAASESTTYSGDTSLTGDKWIVLALTSPSQSLPAYLPSLMRNEETWNVVVIVSNKDAPVQVNEDAQQQVIPRSVFLHHSVPSSYSASKNLGYMFAIQHGAEIIYDADEETAPAQSLSALLQPAPREVVVQETMNPFAYFGQPSIWPRGFPLSRVNVQHTLEARTWNVTNSDAQSAQTTPEDTSATKTNNNNNNNNGHGCWIRQGLADGEPDVDAVFQFTRIVADYTPTVAFTPALPPLGFGGAAYGPVNAHSTLFVREALWATVLAPASSKHTADVWRGYWAQRVMRELIPTTTPAHTQPGNTADQTALNTAATICYVGPFARRTRTASSRTTAAQLSQLLEEAQGMYGRTEQLLAFLEQWRRPIEAKDAREVGLALTHAMALAGFFKSEDVQGIAAFFNELHALGYIFPRVASTHSDGNDNTGNAVQVADHEKHLLGGSPQMQNQDSNASTTTLLRIRVGTDPIVLQRFAPSHVVAEFLPSSTAFSRRIYSTAALFGATGPVADARMQQSGVSLNMPRIYLNATAFSFPWWDIAHMQTTVAGLWREAVQYDEKKTRIVNIAAESFVPTPKSEYPHCSILKNALWSSGMPRILFVVNFHWSDTATNTSVHQQIDILFSHYFNTPFDVVFVGPGKGSDYILGNGLPDDGVLSYHSLTVAYRRYPDYDGYFLVNDDSALVQTHFQPNMFNWRWELPFIVGAVATTCRPSSEWYWTRDCQKTIAALQHMCNDHFRPDCGGLFATYRSQSDAFYVPQRLMGAYVRWSDFFVERKIFLEIAVPTIMQAIADVHCSPTAKFNSAEIGQRLFLDIDISVPLCTTWEAQARSNLSTSMILQNHYNANLCVMYHPVKLNSKRVRDKVSAFMHAQAMKQCHSQPNKCHVSYTRQHDGLLWKARHMAADEM